jgi:hypothetical protein
MKLSCNPKPTLSYSSGNNLSATLGCLPAQAKEKIISSTANNSVFESTNVNLQISNMKNLAAISHLSVHEWKCQNI